jgi:hypothetical protein
MEAPEVAVCIVTETELEKLPPLGVIVGVATVLTVGKLTVKLNVVVLVTPPPDAVTVTGELPAAVELLVLMVSVEEQLGLQLVEEKEAVAPAGKPEAEKVTAWAVPEAKVVLIELVTEEPATTDVFPALDTEKLKGWLTLNEALASALALDPLLSALAFTIALFVRVMAPLYRVDDWVGVEPSVV